MNGSAFWPDFTVVFESLQLRRIFLDIYLFYDRIFFYILDMGHVHSYLYIATSSNWTVCPAVKYSRKGFSLVAYPYLTIEDILNEMILIVLGSLYFSSIIISLVLVLKYN